MQFRYASFFPRMLSRRLSSTSHYTSLGLTPAATQADIKKAYYELSKIYHPDKNDGSEESLRMFRAITSAYEILGNENLRQEYDKNRISKENFNEKVRNIEIKIRTKKYKKAHHTGKTPNFDFDEWYRSHYEIHQPLQYTRSAFSQVHKPSSLGRHSAYIVCVILLSSLVLLLHFRRQSSQYDTVRKKGS